MSRTLPPWIVAGVLLAMLIGVIEAFVGYILDIRSWGTLAPEPTADGFGPDGYTA